MNVVVLSTYDIASTIEGSNVYRNLFYNFHNLVKCKVTYRVKKIPFVLIILARLTRLFIKSCVDPKTTYEATRSPIVFLYYVVTSWFDSFFYSKNTIFITNTSALILAPLGFQSYCIIDWTYDFYFKCIACRTPDVFERVGILLERLSLKSFNRVFTLFMFSSRYLQRFISNPSKVFYIGNGTNISKQTRPIYRVLNSSCLRLLFVGRLHYIQSLFKTFDLALSLSSFSLIRLDVIGITQHEFDQVARSRFAIPSNFDIFFHGYLDISKKDHLYTYVSLLQSSNFLVNLTPHWCSFQAVLDAINFSVPIIITYNTLITTELSDINTFAYVIPSDFSPSQRSSMASRINHLSLSDYHKMCSSAFSSSQSYSWIQVASNLIDLIHT